MVRQRGLAGHREPVLALLGPTGVLPACTSQVVLSDGAATRANLSGTIVTPQSPCQHGLGQLVRHGQHRLGFEAAVRLFAEKIPVAVLLVRLGSWTGTYEKPTGGGWFLRAANILSPSSAMTYGRTVAKSA